ncbi:MAG: hypothetical protein IJV52_08695, partial [Prevotella sp.]|nr:hypothetical protein [Prevotella sp.]
LTQDGSVYKMTSTDGFVISTDKNLKVANTGSIVNLKSISDQGGAGGTNADHKTYAQQYITATFGGFDKNNWESMTIADKAIGAPLDDIGDYSIKSSMDAELEVVVTCANGTTSRKYNHAYTNDASVHERTFHLPSQGGYVRFEPEKDGDLTVWVLQQGALNYHNDVTLTDKFIRLRPVYLIDEQGKSYAVKNVRGVPQVWSAARLSENWSKIKATADANGWTEWNGYQDGVQNVAFTKEESAAVYELYDNYITTNHINIGDPIKPFAIHTGSTISQNNGRFVDSSNDQTGYVLASGGYAKYTFEVKAGKTYYFFGQGTKIGVRGFQFIPTETGAHTQVAINDNSDVTYITDNIDATLAKTPVDVTVNRTFTKDIWAALVLPFSVSQTQLEQAFSDETGVTVIHFNDITNGGNNIQLMKHAHQMIVAGTPVLIKTAKTVSNPTFTGVRITTDQTDNITGSCDDYTMMGTLIYRTAGAEGCMVMNDYYTKASTGDFQLLTSANAAAKATRTWLRPKSGEARELTVSMDSFSDGLDNSGEEELDGIRVIFDEEGNMLPADGIYDLSGRKVSTTNLPKGVYVVNGKKVVIK